MPTVPQHAAAQWACLMGWGGRIFLTEKQGRQLETVVWKCETEKFLLTLRFNNK